MAGLTREVPDRGAPNKRTNFIGQCWVVSPPDTGREIIAR